MCEFEVKTKGYLHSSLSTALMTELFPEPVAPMTPIIVCGIGAFFKRSFPRSRNKAACLSSFAAVRGAFSSSSVETANCSFCSICSSGSSAVVIWKCWDGYSDAEVGFGTDGRGAWSSILTKIGEGCISISAGWGEILPLSSNAPPNDFGVGWVGKGVA